MILADSILAKAGTGDLPTLVDFDARGLFIGPGETPPTFAKRLAVLRGHFEDMEEELTRTGKCVVEDVAVDAAARIDPQFFAEAGEITDAHYAFRIDWVPGFYLNPKMAWLFGGCAFSYYPDFFVFFIIRQVFAKQAHWLFYERRELLSHELCHVARIALQSQIYEERCAYQTSATGFRRHLGSVFRTQTDSFLLLGSTLLLLFAQVLQTVLFPRLPVFLFWGVVAGVFLYLLGRHALSGRRFSLALRALALVFGERARAVLFRCTDAEVLELARLRDATAASAWLAARADAEWRWKIITARFR